MGETCSQVEEKKPLALISVYNKTGLVEFAKGLVDLGWDILASGGTADRIRKAGLPVTDVAEWVGGKATEGHLVVTLSRQVATALLSDNDAEIEAMGVRRISLVRCDMYPLIEAISKPDSTRELVIDKTDIGGPTMIREGAKGGRIVICDQADCEPVLEMMKEGRLDEHQVRLLAAKAEYVVAHYVMASARYHGGSLGSPGMYDGLSGTRVDLCKYGENAWQTPAGLYTTDTNDPLALDKFQVVAGDKPSYNNWKDLDRLLQTGTHIASGFALNFGKVPPFGIAVKHGNACGAAVADTEREAIEKMVMGDTTAIMGGLVLVNFVVDDGVAELLLTHGQLSGRRLLDAIAAPAFTQGAIEMLSRKGDKCRFLANLALGNLSADCLDRSRRIAPVRGGFLVQPNYTYVINVKQWEGELSQQEEQDVVLAWAIGSTSNSNTICLVRDGMLLGNGVGQQDRVGAAKLAVERASRMKHSTVGAIAYSDSFFPFPDGPKVLVGAGVELIHATSGSVKDDEVIAYCEGAGAKLITVPDKEGRGFFGH